MTKRQPGAVSDMSGMKGRALARGRVRASADRRLPREPGRLSNAYSMFCTCSRICSMATLSSSGDLRELGVDRLGAQRVRLAMKLLREEVQPLAHAAAGSEDAPHLGDMGREAGHFLGHVHLGREHGELLAQAFLGRDRRPPRAAARRAFPRRRHGSPGRGGPRGPPGPRCPGSGASSRCFSLSPSRAREAASSERASLTSPCTRAASASGGRAVSTTTPGQRRISATVSGAASGTSRRISAALRARSATRWGSTASVPAPSRRADRDPAFDLPALQLGGDAFAQRGLEHAELVREAQDEVEVAVVDGAELDRQGGPGELRGNRRESGHAEDHGRSRALLGGFPRCGEGGRAGAARVPFFTSQGGVVRM